MKLVRVLLVALVMLAPFSFAACRTAGGCGTGCKGCAPDRNCCDGCRQGTGCTCPR